jgi:hypothetical protein
MTGRASATTFARGRSSARGRARWSVHLTDYDQGVFASIFYTMHAGTVLVGAMGQAMRPPLARHDARGETHLAARSFCGEP